MSVVQPSAAPAWQLVLACVAGPDTGKQVALTEQEVILGRAADSGLLSADPHVAERHTAVRLADGKLHFRALGGEATPVFIDNTTPQAEGTLDPGKQVQIGSSMWQFGYVAAPVPAPAPVVAPPPVGAAPPVAASGAPTAAAAPSVNVSGIFDRFGQHVATAAGVEKLEGFNAREMFSGIAQKRTDEDVEELFILGTPNTTPPLDLVDPSWPKPWLFFKTFTLSILVYMGFALSFSMFKNANLIPGLIIVGSFAVPLSVIFFYYEMNVLRNISIYQVLKSLMAGGILSLFTSLIGFQFLGGALGWLGASSAGIIEETGKLLALVLLYRKTEDRWTLNGLLLGGCIGAGFAAFESAGYALRIAMQGGVDAMFSNITLRGLLAPGGHVAWTALVGAALWKVRGNQPLSMAHLTDIRFLRVFLMSVALHMIWNSNLPSPFFIRHIILVGLAWLVILLFVQDGLKQVRDEQKALGITPPGQERTAPATV